MRSYALVGLAALVLVACANADMDSTTDAELQNQHDAAPVDPITTFAGWALLSSSEQGMLSALLHGTENPWSSAVVSVATRRFADPAWPTLSGDEQVAFLRSLWTVKQAQQTSFLHLLAGRQPAAFTLEAPKSIGEQEFVGGKAVAIRTDVHIDGRMIPIFVAEQPPADVLTLDVAACTAALAKLPLRARGRITSVVVNPFRDPRDAEYDAQFGVTGFRTFMEGRRTGRIDVYPQVRVRDDIAEAMLHEIGHVWSVHDLTDAEWNAWDAAATTDGHFVTKYASTFKTEDLAETWAIFAGFEDGSQGWREAAAMFPARFAFIGEKGPKN